MPSSCPYTARPSVARRRRHIVGLTTPPSAPIKAQSGLWMGRSVCSSRRIAVSNSAFGFASTMAPDTSVMTTPSGKLSNRTLYFSRLIVSASSARACSVMSVDTTAASASGVQRKWEHVPAAAGHRDRRPETERGPKRWRGQNARVGRPQSLAAAIRRVSPDHSARRVCAQRAAVAALAATRVPPIEQHRHGRLRVEQALDERDHRHAFQGRRFPRSCRHRLVLSRDGDLTPAGGARLAARGSGSSAGAGGGRQPHAVTRDSADSRKSQPLAAAPPSGEPFREGRVMRARRRAVECGHEERPSTRSPRHAGRLQGLRRHGVGRRRRAVSWGPAVLPARARRLPARPAGWSPASSARSSPAAGCFAWPPHRRGPGGREVDAQDGGPSATSTVLSMMAVIQSSAVIGNPGPGSAVARRAAAPRGLGVLVRLRPWTRLPWGGLLRPPVALRRP